MNQNQEFEEIILEYIKVVALNSKKTTLLSTWNRVDPQNKSLQINIQKIEGKFICSVLLCRKGKDKQSVLHLLFRESLFNLLAGKVIMYNQVPYTIQWWSKRFFEIAPI